MSVAAESGVLEREAVAKTRPLDRFDALVERVSRTVNYFSMALIMVAMLFITADVAGKSIRRPIPGGLEVSEMLLAGIALLAMARTMRTGGNVSVNLLVRRLPRRAQLGIDAFNNFLMLGVWSLIGWRSYVMAIENSREVTDQLRFPLLYPRHLVPIAAFFCVWVLIALIVSDIRKMRASG